MIKDGEYKPEKETKAQKENQKLIVKTSEDLNQDKYELLETIPTRKLDPKHKDLLG